MSGERVTAARTTNALTGYLRECGRRMVVTLTRNVQKRCPYVDEVDRGTVTLTFHTAEAPEMYELAQWLNALGDGPPITHEEWTAAVAAHVPEAAVISEWLTDVWTMRVEVR